MEKKRTKIVATIGPASQSVPTLTSMMRGGMNVARLNFSHGTHASHRKLVKNIRAASKKAKKNVAVLGDLQGPKIRIGDIGGPRKLKKGETITLPVSLKGLGKNMRKNQRVLFDDGKYEAKYISGKDDTITVQMSGKGVLDSHKGISVPGIKLKKISALTTKDKLDTEFAVKIGVDWIVLSFVVTPKEVLELRALLKKLAKKDAPKLMIKVERALAVEDFDVLLKVCDGVMIGRGDLALDMPFAKVPVAQKMIVDKCRKVGKPVIVATQMLESMTKNRVPTRAEVSDVANAVIDHTDAVMLSGESASGEYPVETIKMMRDIIVETEASVYDDIKPKMLPKRAGRGEVFAQAMAEMVSAGRVQSIAVEVKNLDLAWKLSRFRPEVKIFVFGTDPKELRELLMRWGVEPVKVPSLLSFEEPQKVAKWLKKNRYLATGKTVTLIGYRKKEPYFTTVKVK